MSTARIKKHLNRFDANGYKGQDMRPKPRDVAQLAKDYAEHMMATGQNVAHVYPAKRSGHAADFRRHLAAYLVGHDPDRPIYVGSRYIHTNHYLRFHFESRLSAFDFKFVEVDLTEY